MEQRQKTSLAGDIVKADVKQPIYLYIQIELCKKESLKDWLAEKRTLDQRGHDKVTLHLYFSHFEGFQLL